MFSRASQTTGLGSMANGFERKERAQKLRRGVKIGDGREAKKDSRQQERKSRTVSKWFSRKLKKWLSDFDFKLFS